MMGSIQCDRMTHRVLAQRMIDLGDIKDEHDPYDGSR